MSKREITETNPLPRRIAPGVYWLGQCILNDFQGDFLHAYNSVYVVDGPDGSTIVEGGHIKDIDMLIGQMRQLFDEGVALPTRLLITHSETAHSGGTGRILDEFPNVVAYGDVEDLHLVFDRHESRLHQNEVGDFIGPDNRFEVVDSVLRDMPRTRWFFDHQSGSLFTGDGFAYSHFHEAGQCGKIAEEAPGLVISYHTKLITDAALYWTRHSNIEPYIDELDRMVYHDLKPKVIGPTHGLPITDPVATFPEIRKGLAISARATYDSY